MNMERSIRNRRTVFHRQALVSSVLVSGLGPTIVAGTGFLLHFNAVGIADLYFGLFKNTGFLLPVVIGLVLSVIGALPGIIVLSESFQTSRRIAATLTIFWAVICLILCLSLSDFA